MNTWRRARAALAQPRPTELVSADGGVRMRRLVCVCCRRWCWIVVGPPRCPSCIDQSRRRPEPTESTEPITPQREP